MISIYSGLDVCICKIVLHGGFLFCVWIEARACESSKVHCTHLQSLAYSCGSYCVHLQPFWDKCISVSVIFASTCEQVFSDINYMKSKHHCFLTDDTLQSCMNIKVTSYISDIKKLCSDAEKRKSHKSHISYALICNK